MPESTSERGPRGIAIVYALREELKPILKESRIGTRILKGSATLEKAEFRNVPVVFCRTGLGISNAREATERLIEYSRPSLILSVGWAGAANAELATGDVVLPSEIVSETSPDRFVPDKTARSELERLIREEQIPYQTGPLMTLSKLGGISAKEEAGQKGAAATDMETATIATVAEKSRIPFVSLRVIFDTLEEELPFSTPFDENHPIQFLLQNPRAILKIPHYARMNRTCQHHLARILSRFMDCYGR